MWKNMQASFNRRKKLIHGNSVENRRPPGTYSRIQFSSSFNERKGLDTSVATRTDCVFSD